MLPLVDWFKVCSKPWFVAADRYCTVLYCYMSLMYNTGTIPSYIALLSAQAYGLESTLATRAQVEEIRETKAMSQIEKLKAAKAAKAAQKKTITPQLPVQPPLSPPKRNVTYITQEADDDWDDYAPSNDDNLQTSLTFVENSNDM